MATVLWWLRRDFRLTDNPALLAACEQGAVVPVYVHAPEEDGDWPPGAAQRWWLHQGLAAMDARLREHGSRLVLRRGPSLEALEGLAEETGATAVVWNRLYEPAAMARDGRIEARLGGRLEARSFNAALLWEPWEIETRDGGPYRVFTPFWRRCEEGGGPPGPRPAPDELLAPACWPENITLDELELMPEYRWYDGIAEGWTPGEPSALGLLGAFVRHGLGHYKTRRDLPGMRGTSRLSPHLHFGEISPRTIWEAVAARRPDAALEASAEAFLRELGWREFAHHVLCHFPHTPLAPLDGRFRAFPWQDGGEDLEAWRRGRTGIPLVDAGMRELWRTGWMHNRLRMVAASFLTKNLGVHWLQGARWFWDSLVDADLANNTLGWQWAAGCGADAAPYFRILNPVRQGERFDPDGEYVRRWVPELAGIGGGAVHAPRAAGDARPGGYPAPLVDLKESRAAALAAYGELAGGS